MNYELQIKKSRKAGYTRLVDFGDAISSRIKNASPKLTTGYTIIETMIAISLFIIIVMAGMGSLLNANLLHQKSRDMRSIMDNLSFVMEDMSRNLRTGYEYKCISQQTTFDVNLASPQNCTNSGSWAIVFKPQGYNSDPASPSYNPNQWVYFMGVNNGKSGIFKSVDGGTTFTQLNPDEIVIDMNASNFTVVGAELPEAGDFQQPFVTIKLAGKITYKNVDSPFSLQTSVSQRLLDN